MDSSINRRNRLRLNILLVILATIPCYCLGLFILQVKNMVQNRPTITPSATFVFQQKTMNYELPTKITTITVTPTLTFTTTITWTATITKSPFYTPTRTITPTPSDTVTPTETSTPTVTDTSPPPTETDTQIPPTETYTETPVESLTPSPTE